MITREGFAKVLDFGFVQAGLRREGQVSDKAKAAMRITREPIDKSASAAG